MRAKCMTVVATSIDQLALVEKVECKRSAGKRKDSISSEGQIREGRGLSDFSRNTGLHPVRTKHSEMPGADISIEVA